EFDEPKGLFEAEPFDDTTNRWAGRGLKSGLGEAGSGAERIRLRVEGISGEVATPRLTEILMSQLGFLKGDARLVRGSGARRPLPVTDGIEVWSMVMRRGSLDARLPSGKP